MLSLWRDLLYAARVLAKSPGLVVVAVASLALGIGANITAYSVVREMILDDLSAREPQRLARAGGEVDYAMYRELRHAGVFQDLAFNRHLNVCVWQDSARGEMAWSIETSANFFDVLGVRGSLGRLYSQADEGRAVAAVSYGFWRKRMGAAPHAIGRPLQLNGRLYTVVGVLPGDYRSIYGHGVSPEVYIQAGAGEGGWLFGRLRDGSSREQARQALAAAAEALGGRDLARRVAELRPMSGLAANAAKGGDERRFFVFFAMLFSVAGMMALIACSNVAGLLLARGLSRQREMAIRRAVGASRLRIVRQLLAEGLVLVACGAGAGLLLDGFLRDRLSYIRWPSAYGLPIEFHFNQDSGLFLYAAAAALAALLVSSVIPALRGSNTDLTLAMKQGQPAFSVRHWDARNGFVALQLALATVLLTLGALFTRSFWYVASCDPGFDVAHTIVAGIQPLPGRHPDDGLWKDRVVRRLEEIPGVIAASSAGVLPLAGEMPRAHLRRQGEGLSAARDVYTVGAGPRYCLALGMHLLRGRDLEAADRTRQPAPVVVNRTLAREFFAGRNPVGERLLMGREEPQIVEVVGVTADAKVRSMGEAEAPALYIASTFGPLVVRVAGEPANWIAPVRSALGGMDPTAGIDVRPMQEAAAGAIFPMRVASGFLGALSGLGVVLALIGLYGSVSYAVGRRMREMGIRLALGAPRGRIVWVALRDALVLLSCGAIAGLALAAAAIRPLAGLLPDGVPPWDPVALTVPALLLVAAGSVAAWVPSRRAAHADPAAALRQD
ncbi:MAG TPA: FtsX-like permease family protein [Bryobacteraceae bacterium]|jgi:predicted permease|nr:FtsX-like permease family protein [Bryobacteraceae bacterium]